jgi:hypothetical protein
MKSSPPSPDEQIALHLRRNWVICYVLGDDEETVFILEGLIDLNDLWMVERGEYAVLIDDICW